MPTISLCMIVKDEAHFLGGCLDSVRRAVDEIIVVDTGSSDATVSIATAAGAVVAHHSWTDDFAAARNVAVAHATCDFVLMLDADERLAPGAWKALRRAVRSNGLDGGLLPLHNAASLDATPAEILSGTSRLGEPFLLPRLFRRTADLKWEGAVHETTRSWSHVAGRRLFRVDAPILHFGYVEEVYEARDKAARNLAILHKRVASEPGDPDGRIYLAEALAAAGDHRAALAEARQAWVDLRAMPPARQKRPLTVTLVTIFLRCALATGSADDLQAILTEGRSWGLRHANLDHLEARLLEIASRGAADEADQLTRATTLYERCLRIVPREDTCKPLPGVHGPASWLRLGIIGLRRSRWAKARLAFDKVLVAHPELPAARLGMAEALVGLGDGVGALSLLEPLLGRPSADAWALAAAAAGQTGANGDAMALLQEAVRRAAAGFEEPHRIAWLRHVAAALEPVPS